MILYKYYGFKAGLAALKKQTLGFRVPLYFNDLFEASLFDEDSMQDRINKILEDVAILCLTRTPLNPLMWAHYGEEHRGFVIGYEVDTPFFLSNESNLISLTNGNVIYTKTKPFRKISDGDEKLLSLVVNGLEELNDHTKQLINHLFLNKDTMWSYEEEVRIVKRLVNFAEDSLSEYPHNTYSSLLRKNRNSEYRSTEKIKGLRIFNYSAEIKEIYLGNRSSFLEESNFLNAEGFKKMEKYINQGTMIYFISKDQESWNLNGNLIKTP